MQVFAAGCPFIVRINSAHVTALQDVPFKKAPILWRRAKHGNRWEGDEPRTAASAAMLPGIEEHGHSMPMPGA